MPVCAAHDAECDHCARTLAEAHPERHQRFLAERRQHAGMPGLG
jgi:hypothetical protein